MKVPKKIGPGKSMWGDLFCKKIIVTTQLIGTARAGMHMQRVYYMYHKYFLNNYDT